MKLPIPTRSAAAAAALVATFTLGSVCIAENQAYLGIFAETRVMKMMGMPDLSEMIKNLPPGMLASNPALANMMALAAPQRSLTVRLWSPGVAPQKASAALAIPPGLKLGERLDLELYRPEAEKHEVGGEGDASLPNFTIKYYWGSSPTVKPGQPIVVDIKTMMTPAMIANMRAAMKKGGGHNRNQYFYKPDWTTGYWPSTDKGPSKIEADAGMGGTYTLTTNYTGQVTLDIPNNVTVLAPLEFTAPKLDAPPPLDQPLAFTWKPVPQVLGYNMMIIGMQDMGSQGNNTLIIWQSSEIRADMGVDWDYMQMSQVRELVKSNVLMGSERKDVTVPAGIFAEADMANLMMVGYGPGAARANGQPLPRAQTKTTMTVMLGGKKMPRQGMPPME